jgi:CHAT domain-containing protein/Tfp pilus assembly protein PilF
MRERKICAFALMTLLSLSALSARAPSPASYASEADMLHWRVYELQKAGKYSDAVPLAIQSLDLREKVDPNNLHTAESLQELVTLYNRMGDYAKAEPLCKRALQIYEKALGPEHPVATQCLDNLATIYQEMGDYAKAEPLFQRALKLVTESAERDALSNKVELKGFGPEPPDAERVKALLNLGTARSLDLLAELYRAMRDYAKAEPLFQRALKIRETALGPEDLVTAMSLNSLALLYLDMGDYAKAEPLFQRSLKICEKARGPEHPDTASSLNNLAVVYENMGDYAKAEPLHQRALKIREKALGHDHSYTAQSLNNLAQLYRGMGDYAKAEPLFQRSLEISEKALGRENPYTALSLTGLAFLHYEMGDLKEGLRLAEQARRAQEKTLSNILSFTSEQQRLAFQTTTHPYNLPATLGSAPELAEIVLRQKGVVLDSLLEDRIVAEASQDPRQQKSVTELRGAKQRVMQLLLEAPKDTSEQALKKRDTEKKDFSQRVEQLEAGLARQVTGLGHARRALSVTVPQVKGALGKDEALIELLRYDHDLGKNKFEARYGAVVIAPRGEPKWIPLGRATEIEKNIAIYQKSARGKTDEATLNTVLHALHTQVWALIEKALPSGTKTIIVSPDAALNFVSFATLVGPDDKFVAEKYSIRYVASGRDLLRQANASGHPDVDVYANPDFGSKPASPDFNRGTAVALRSIEMRDLQSISLPPLPGAAVEAAAIEKRAGKSVKVFLGASATEANLRQVSSPRVLHLATHGFFLREIDLGKSIDPLQPGQEIPKGKLVNPMHRSGLALAGAQTTLQAWRRGETPPTENDGIVTAEEVGGLKLDGTWLAVLSACETGSGEARAGEGVMGLRRGFIQAGAQNLLMTLWPISDQTTVQIMLDFYDAAEKANSAPQALADVQRDWLVKLRKEHGLVNAVRLAGPFIMSSQGKP